MNGQCRFPRRDFLQRALFAGVSVMTSQSCATQLSFLSSALENRLIAEIPFETSLDVPFVQANVNVSGPFGFLLDTGGGGSLIDSALADRLKLEQQAGSASVSGDAALQVGVIPRVSIALQAARFESQLLATSFGVLEQIFGRPLEGILGGSFMKQFIVELDFDKRLMQLIGDFDLQAWRQRPGDSANACRRYSLCRVENQDAERKIRQWAFPD
jgi:hypothetical protein